MNKGTEFNITKDTATAIKQFWLTKNRQQQHSADSSNRGAVIGGKQLDGFLTLLANACRAVGVPSECLYFRDNFIPGFFRSSKDWDFLVISPQNRLMAVVELKSQVGSYGNNFNNRAEEAIGNATDLWTAYREKEFPTFGPPWVGFLMVIGDEVKSNLPVRNHTNHFPVLPEFENASYIDRYRILCEKLMTERLYSSTCLIRTKNADNFSNVTEDLSIQRFIHSLQGHLIGNTDEFHR